MPGFGDPSTAKRVTWILHVFGRFFMYLCYFASLSWEDNICNLILHKDEGFKVLEEDFLLGLRERMSFIVNCNL